MQSQKWQNDLCSFPRQTIQYHSNPNLCPNQNAEEADAEWFYEDLQDLLELIPPKDCLFIIGDWNAKVGSQEILRINRQVWPWSTERSRAKTIEFCQLNSLVTANTLCQQHRRRLCTWTSPDGQHRNQIDYILCSQNWEALYSQQKQDQELTVAQIINSLWPNSDLNWRK